MGRIPKWETHGRCRSTIKLIHNGKEQIIYQCHLKSNHKGLHEARLCCKNVGSCMITWGKRLRIRRKESEYAVNAVSEIDNQNFVYLYD